MTRNATPADAIGNRSADDPTAPAVVAHLSSARLTIAIVALGAAVHDNDGTLAQAALAWLTIAIVYAFWAMLHGHEVTGRLHHAVRTVALIVSAGLFCRSGVAAALPEHQFRIALLLSAALAVAAVAICLARTSLLPRLHQVMLFLAAAYALLLLTQLPVPGIDVLQYQRESATAVLEGRPPYALTFRDPYTPEESAQFFGPGLSVGGVLQFGNPYMPLVTLLALPGLLLGDVRYASGLALLVAAWLIAAATRSRSGYLGSALLLLCPAFPDLVVFGWTEAYVVLLLSATWYCRCRAPAWLPYAAGLFFVSKQYTIILAPALLLLLPRPWRWADALAFGLRAAVAALLVTLPMVLRDPDAFLRSAVLLQFRQPFRVDALSYLAMAHPADPQRWMPLPFGLAACAWAVIFRRDRLRPVVFPLAAGLALLVFFAFNKQAFLNYYFLVIAALCAALAADGADQPPLTARR